MYPPSVFQNAEEPIAECCSHSLHSRLHFAMGQMSSGLSRQRSWRSVDLRAIFTLQHTAPKMQRLVISDKHTRRSQSWGQGPSRPQLRSKLNTSSCPEGRPPKIPRKLGLAAESARLSDREPHGGPSSTQPWLQKCTCRASLVGRPIFRSFADSL